MADIMLINITEGAPAGGFACDGTSEYSYLDSVLPAYLLNDFHYTFCAEPVYYMQLAADIRNAGMSVEIVDGILQNLRVTDIEDIIRKTDSRIFGLTMFQANYHVVMSVIAFIKDLYPNSIVFSGGTYSSIVYEKLLLRHYELDYVVVGDGDAAVPALVKALLNKEDVSTIPGVAYKEDDKVKITPPVPVNMDDIPYLSRDFAEQVKGYDFSFSMVTSRGCGHGVCSFCYLPMYQENSNHPKFRYRDPKLVVGEMREIKEKYDVNRVTFVDEDYFGVHSIGVPRAEAIADLLIENNLGITYYVNARINSLFEVINRGLLPKLARSGLRYVFVGIESGSDEILRKYKKGIIVDKIKKVVDELAKYNIKINPGLITFDPELTIDQVNDNVQMLKYIGYYDIFMYTRKLILLPGIEVGEVNQGWELPSIHDEEIFQQKYFKYDSTNTLYEAMVWYRNTIFPMYQRIYQSKKIKEEIRNELISNHFNAFDNAVEALRKQEALDCQAVCDTMNKNVIFVKKMVDELC